MSTDPGPTTVPARDRPHARGSLRALLVANRRFWPSVAPLVRREIASWEQCARQIGDRELRELALDKLKHEAFNAEVAATLATLSPPGSRTTTVRAIVTLELLFDYLDGRTERGLGDPIEDGLRLFGAFTSALAPGPAPVPPAESSHAQVTPSADDRAYLAALGAKVRDDLQALAGAGVVGPVAYAAAERCAQAQVRLHAAATLGDGQLERWARGLAEGSGLEWREYLAGCASSVLAVHALIAAAADPRTSARDAQRIDRAYLTIGAIVTMLDSLVDRTADASSGEAGFLRLFADDREVRERLRALLDDALARAREAPNGGHHAMTLAGVAAFYTTHPGARDAHAREIARMVRHELSPTIWPAVAVMRAWRMAKAVRGVRGTPPPAYADGKPDAPRREAGVG